MNLHRHTSVTAILGLLALGLTGCGTLSTLQLIVDTTEAALPVLESAGVPIPPEVSVYVGDVANCIGSQTGTLTPAQLSVIALCLSKQVTPTLTGLPQAIVKVVADVIQAVANYLAQTKQSATTSISAGDAMKYTALQARAQTTVKRSQALTVKLKSKK